MRGFVIKWERNKTGQQNITAILGAINQIFQLPHEVLWFKYIWRKRVSVHDSLEDAVPAWFICNFKCQIKIRSPRFSITTGIHFWNIRQNIFLSTIFIWFIVSQDYIGRGLEKAARGSLKCPPHRVTHGRLAHIHRLLQEEANQQ